MKEIKRVPVFLKHSVVRIILVGARYLQQLQMTVINDTSQAID